MAQVKKFKTPAGPVTVEDKNAVKPAGTSTPTGEAKKKYGKWIRDGIETEMTDESIKAFLEDARKGDSDDQLFANDVVAQIRRGEDVMFNTLTNETNVVPSNISERQRKRLEKDIDKERVWDSMWNTRVHRINKSIQRVGQWNPEQTVAKESEVKKPTLGLATSGSAFQYESGDGKTYTYRDLINTDEKDHWDNWYRYLTNSAERANYDTSGFSNVNNLTSWFDNIKDENGIANGKQWLDNLWAAIQSGSELNQNQLDYLEMIGLGYNRTPSPEVAQQIANQKATDKKVADWTIYNKDGLWTDTDRDNYFTYNDDGTFTLNTSKLPSGFDVSKNYFFNDEFIEQDPIKYKWLKNKIYYDGKWYNGSDLKNVNSDIYRRLSARGYFDLNRAGKYKEANDIMMTSWKGQDTKLVPSQSDATAGYLGDFYQHPFLYDDTNYNIKGATYNGQVIPEDYSVRMYQNMRDNNANNFLDDGTGRRKFRWLMTDAYGNIVSNFNDQIISMDLDPTLFSGIYTPATYGDAPKLTPVSRITKDRNDKNFYNRYHFATTIGEKTLIDAYIDPQNTTKVHAALSTELGGDGQNVFLDMPIEVYNVISNQDFLASLNGRRDLKEKFANLVGNKTRVGRQIDVNELNGLINNKALAQSIIDYFRNHYANPKTVAKPVLNKNGGILKAQAGLTIHHAGYNPEKTLSRASELNIKFSNPYESRMVRENGDWKKIFAENLSDTDKLELAALVADGAGMVVGWAPVGGDLVNIGLGTASNIMNAIADRRKVKEGALSSGTALKNFLIGTGIDIASVAPGVGDALNGVAWGKKLANFFSKSKPVADAVTSAMMAWGLVDGVGALQKVMSGEDLSMNEIRDLVYGIGSVTGLAGKLGRHFSDARLAANTQKDVKPLTRTTKYKAEDGTEKSVTFTEGDIATITKGKGDTKSKKALSDKLEEAGVPAAEVNRIMNNPEALKELGLVHNTPNLWFNSYSEVKPESKHSTGYYFINDRVRNKELKSRTNEELVKGSSTDPKAVARWWDYDKGIPAGYSVNRNKVVGYTKIKPETAKVETPETSINPEIKNNVEPPKTSSEPPKTSSVEEPTVKNTVPITEPVPSVEPTQAVNSEDVLSRFLSQSKGGKEQKFLARFNKQLDLPDFKNLAEQDPKTARDVVTKAIDEYIANSKKEKRRTKIAEKAEAMIKGKGYTFREGGVLKADLGMQLRNFWDGAKNVLGKVTPELMNTVASGTRFILGNRYNNRSAELQKNAIQDAVKLSQPITPQEIYTPNYINAGNADRQLAQSKFQFRPAVTSDSFLNQMMKKQNYDEGNFHLANATRLDSQQHRENLLRGVEERRNYAYTRNEAMNQGRKAVASGVTAIAGIEDQRLKANTESINQLIYQGQAQMDQYLNEAKAYADKKSAFDLQQGMTKDYDNWYNKTFTKENPYNPSNAEHNKAIQMEQNRLQNEYQTRGYENLYKGMSGGAQRWYDRMYAKKGGSLRPASDQIRVNKAKSQDKQWENSQKEARKALDKMSDRVHDILMKLLS